MKKLDPNKQRNKQTPYNRILLVKLTVPWIYKEFLEI
jgi:hypothetical protein